MKKSRKESELNTVESQIRGLDARLKFSRSDKEKTVSKLSHLSNRSLVVKPSLYLKLELNEGFQNISLVLNKTAKICLQINLHFKFY